MDSLNMYVLEKYAQEQCSPRGERISQFGKSEQYMCTLQKIHVQKAHEFPCGRKFNILEFEKNYEKKITDMR